MLGGGGIEQKGKRTHGHGQQYGDYWAEGSIRGLNDNGKNIIKIALKIIKSISTQENSNLVNFDTFFFFICFYSI